MSRTLRVAKRHFARSKNAMDLAVCSLVDPVHIIQDAIAASNDRNVNPVPILNPSDSFHAANESKRSLLCFSYATRVLNVERCCRLMMRSDANPALKLCSSCDSSECHLHPNS
ncbi:hypothetical protein PsorP6_001613 [Peronosclerospora sorghi]|uniref:Uncharacterized protein n=1 Tax=Peronosclerospora sorghi TaxID=230839 RepID=A0ACC0WZ47_9STRA|nr:hypothetical protein PsorP6_001613 [Peronosclerospora sorghi]